MYACNKPTWFGPRGVGGGALRAALGEGCEAAGGTVKLRLAAAPAPCTEWAEGRADDVAEALTEGGSSHGSGAPVFAGDHLFGDVAAAAAYGWRAAAVVEEIEGESAGVEGEAAAGPFWGSFLRAAPGEPSFWAGLLSREAGISVSDVAALHGLAEGSVA